MTDPSIEKTKWSLLEAMRTGGPEAGLAALDWFAKTYWSPIYSYVRRSGHSAEDAKDVTQSFFAMVLESGLVEKADPERGRLRTLLLTSLRHFLASDWHYHAAQKRGGGIARVSIDEAQAEAWYGVEPADRLSPDALFNRRWALTLMQQALSAVSDDYAMRGQSEQFDALSPALMHDHAPAGERTPMSNAHRVSLHRLRVAYRDKLREMAAQFLDCPTDQAVAEELRFLLTAVSQ